MNVNSLFAYTMMAITATVLLVIGAILLVGKLRHNRSAQLRFDLGIEQKLDEIVENMGATIEANALNRLREQLEMDPELFQQVQTYSTETELVACIMMSDAIKKDMADATRRLTEVRARLHAYGHQRDAVDADRLERSLDHMMAKLRSIGGKIDNVVALQQKS